MHRPKLDWDNVNKKKQKGSIENRIFTSLKKLIGIRKEIPAFADMNNRNLIDSENPHLLIFSRFDHQGASNKILAISNFHDIPQVIDVISLRQKGFLKFDQVRDLASGEIIPIQDNHLMIPALGFYWLES